MNKGYFVFRQSYMVCPFISHIITNKEVCIVKDIMLHYIKDRIRWELGIWWRDLSFLTRYMLQFCTRIEDRQNGRQPFKKVSCLVDFFW